MLDVMKIYIALLSLFCVGPVKAMLPCKVSLFKALEVDDDLATFKLAVFAGRANVNEKNKMGVPILWHLIAGYWDYCGSRVFFTHQAWIEAVDLLIVHGASINIKTGLGRTLLHQAAMIGSDTIIEMLVAKGININVCDKNGNTPLHDLFKEDLPKINRLAALKKLMLYRADVNATNKLLKIPLHSAVCLLKERDSKEIIPYLLFYGADCKRKDHRKKTAVKKADYITTRNMLRNECATIFSSAPFKKEFPGNIFNALKSRAYTGSHRKPLRYSPVAVTYK